MHAALSIIQNSFYYNEINITLYGLYLIPERGWLNIVHVSLWGTIHFIYVIFLACPLYMILGIASALIWLFISASPVTVTIILRLWPGNIDTVSCRQAILGDNTEPVLKLQISRSRKWSDAQMKWPTFMRIWEIFNKDFSLYYPVHISLWILLLGLLAHILFCRWLEGSLVLWERFVKHGI